MNVDDWVKLLDAVAKLVAAFVWPGLIAFVLWRFAPSLRNFFEALGEFSLKGAGFEASAKRKGEAAALLVAAEARRTNDSEETPRSGMDLHAAGKLVDQEVTPRVLRKLGQASVLWVDDHPQNNVYERQSLEALGARFALAKSTEEALALVQAQPFDAIISDMSRPPDDQAGFTLLGKLRSIGNTAPFIIYASANIVARRAEALKRGAVGCTNRPSELFEHVLSVIRSRDVR